MKITDTIEMLLKRKSFNKVLALEPEQTVYEALEMMAKYDVGALMVCQEASWSGSSPSATMRAGAC